MAMPMEEPRQPSAKMAMITPNNKVLMGLSVQRACSEEYLKGK